MTTDERIGSLVALYVCKKVKDENKDNSVIQETFETAINAIIKQIPIVPKGDYNSVPHHRCPECGSGIRLYENDPYDAYCKFCGQAIDWSD